MDPLIGMLLALPLPAVPAVVELGLLELGLLELALLEPGLVLLVPAAPLEAVDELEAGRALVSMNSLPERAVLDAAPAVPLVPVAPDAPPPPCRQPVTVTVRLELDPGVWLLLVVEPACADMLTAQPSAIANVAPVHTFFIRYLPVDMRCGCAIATPPAGNPNVDRSRSVSRR